VSGTHGKTSTTAMISKVLIDNGLEPIVFAGGSLDFLEGGSSRIGSGEYAVVEADEYDRSFLALKSDYIIVTNIELDHTDIYKNLDDIKSCFTKFCSDAKPGCRFIGCGDDANTKDVLANFQSLNLYGLVESNNYVVKNISEENGKTAFEIDNEARIVLTVFGIHNILNATAAYIAAKNIGIETQGILKSLESFDGVQRRLQLKYQNNIKVYDDYAHHPTEISSSLKALRSRSDARIISVFQPHTFSRTRAFFKEFAEALSGNDVIVLAKIYPAREKEIKGVNSKLIFNEIIKNADKEVYLIEDFGNILKELDRIIKPGDTIVFQGAGDITNLCDKYIRKLNKPV